MRTISLDAATRFGCPACGYRFFSTVMPLNGQGTLMKCSDCREEFLVLSSGVKQIQFGNGIFKLQFHPREGMSLRDRRAAQ